MNNGVRGGVGPRGEARGRGAARDERGEARDERGEEDGAPALQLAVLPIRDGVYFAALGESFPMLTESLKSFSFQERAPFSLPVKFHQVHWMVSERGSTHSANILSFRQVPTSGVAA